jgi:enoyl-CoA hydratase/carnithine racemase
MNGHPWVTRVTLASRIPAALLDDEGRPAAPVLLVDLDVDDGDPTPAAFSGQPGDHVVIGVTRRTRIGAALHPLVDSLDLTLASDDLVDPGAAVVSVPDPTAAAEALCAAVAAAPIAATTLAGLLRWTPALPVPVALDAESLAYSTLLGGTVFHEWLVRRGVRPTPPATDQPVLVARDDDLLRITLHRPERRNAYGRQVRDALVTALQVADADPGVRRIVLDGAGPAFCSGGDLDEFGTAPDTATAHLIRTRAGAGRLLHRLADRLEVVVHGHCVGAGIELPAFAHRIVAHRDTLMRLPELGMGLIPGAGGTVSIPRRIGRWRTLYLALSGSAIDASTALAWGLIDEIDDVAPAENSVRPGEGRCGGVGDVDPIAGRCGCAVRSR